jgi:hypothetical protein
MVDEKPSHTPAEIPDDLPEFICKHWDPVLNIGWIAYVECDKERPRKREAIVGRVLIDGNVYMCDGVERIQTADGPIRKGERIGLSVGNRIG